MIKVFRSFFSKKAFIIMKNLKSKMAAVAILLSAGAAFASAAPAHFANRKWARNPLTNTYIDITGQAKGVDYSCSANTSVICTATYAEGVNPNTQAATPLSTETGEFSQ
jgi:hypothetical protein